MNRRIEPGPGQESVWDYPRPPRVEYSLKHIQVYFDGVEIVNTTRAVRLLETSHPPAYYIPLEDFRDVILVPESHHTVCEFKGVAHYYSLRHGDREESLAAWYYPRPTAGFELIRNCVALYPGSMDLCLVNGDVVTSQPGDFYGGWITSDIVGPFKGGPETQAW